MASVMRQPFAPLDGVRLQSLTSAKNQQASTPLSSPGKRKAADFLNVDDFENIDPVLSFSKRSKASSSGLGDAKSSFTKSSSAPALITTQHGNTVADSLEASRSPSVPDAMLAKKPSSAPAGRSPSRSTKRMGILARWRAATFSRIEPPNGLSSTPLSLDAAIKGTVPSYEKKKHTKVRSTSKCRKSDHSRGPQVKSDCFYGSNTKGDDFYGPKMKSSWEFEIHEDTPEQEMTNLLQHSTCLLDISSDEECEQRLRRGKAEGRDKENIPPADDVSAHRATGVKGGMEHEKSRTALGDLNVEDFYAKGCDVTSVFIIPEDEGDVAVLDGEQPQKPERCALPHRHEVSEGPETPAPATMVPTVTDELQLAEDAGESFDLWESSSAKGEGHGSRSPSPSRAVPASRGVNDDW